MGKSSSKHDNMGGNSSSHESTVKHYNEEETRTIDCNPYVATMDISNFINGKKSELNSEDRQLLQKAKQVVAKEPDYVFRRCEVRVVGSVIDVIFYAGRPSNIYVINLQNVNKKVESLCKSKSFGRHVREFGRSVFKWIRNASPVIGAIAGGAVGLALTAVNPAIAAKIGPIISPAVTALLDGGSQIALKAIKN